MRQGKTGGFTLIELLIVIAIIGILAAVLIPNLLAARTRAFDTATQACGRAIATAQEIHAIDDDGGAYATAYPGALDPDMIKVCTDIPVAVGTDDAYDGDGWTLTHPQSGTKVYVVSTSGIEEDE